MPQVKGLDKYFKSSLSQLGPQSSAVCTDLYHSSPDCDIKFFLMWEDFCLKIATELDARGHRSYHSIYNIHFWKAFDQAIFKFVCQTRECKAIPLPLLPYLARYFNLYAIKKRFKWLPAVFQQCLSKLTVASLTAKLQFPYKV